ncbi:MAG: ABC transporter substrate-binding protein [Candidatus Micrarchaeota archaeon]
MKKFLFALLLFSILLLGCTQKPSIIKANDSVIVPPTVQSNVSNLTNTSEPPAVVKSETVKFGAILPLTGTLANIGDGMKNAMLLAVREINGQGGINGKIVELVIEDSACNPSNGVSAATKLVSIDKVLAVAGPTCSGESLASANVFTDNKVVALSPSATSSKLTTSSDYLFRIVPSDSFQGSVAAKYSRNTLGAKRSAIFYINNDWGVGLRDSFKKTFVDMGGEISTEQSMMGDATDVKTELTRIRALNSDLIYLACYPKECSIALKQISDFGINITVLGADGADDPQTLSSLGNAAEGLTITIASSQNAVDFSKNYKSLYAKEAGAYTAQSYDSINLLASAVKSGAIDGPSIKSYLYGVNYKGVSGNIEFDSNGDLKGYKYDLKKWTNGKFVLLEKAG